MAQENNTTSIDEAAVDPFDVSSPPDYDDWETGNLEFECRRRDVAWAITPDTVVEYQRRKIMVETLRLTEVSPLPVNREQSQGCAALSPLDAYKRDLSAMTDEALQGEIHRTLLACFHNQDFETQQRSWAVQDEMKARRRVTPEAQQ